MPQKMSYLKMCLFWASSNRMDCFDVIIVAALFGVVLVRTQ